MIRKIKSFLRQHGFANKNEFFSMHLRPKRVDAIKSYAPENIPNVGIVIQGPIRKEDNFTIETIKLYKKYYPHTPIIVSTWDTESNGDLAQIKSMCELCVSHFEKEEWANFQRTTSLAGIQKANELGCTWILKTRTDQRMYTPQLLSYFIKLIQDYPLNIQCAAKGRVISCELNTFCNRLYNISDMMIFGYSEDVLRYFSPPLDIRDYSQFKEINNDDFLQYQLEYSKRRIGEIWFASNYIESLGFELKWTFDDSDYYRNNLFIIVDNSTIDIYWPKYASIAEYRWKNYYKQDVYKQVSFREWYMAQSKRI